jgi:hypothetical protein
MHFYKGALRNHRNTTTITASVTNLANAPIDALVTTDAPTIIADSVDLPYGPYRLPTLWSGLIPNEILAETYVAIFCIGYCLYGMIKM